MTGADPPRNTDRYGHADLHNPLLLGQKANLERLPDLRAALSDAAERITQTFRDAYDVAAKFILESIEAHRLGPLLADLGDRVVTAVYRFGDDDDKGCVLLLLDRNASLASVETLLGGDGSEAIATPGPATKIELSLAMAMTHQAGDALREVLHERADLPLTFDRVESDPDAIFGRPSDLVTCATLRMILPIGTSALRIVLPLTLVDAIRAARPPTQLREQPASDPAWRDELTRVFKKVDVGLRAVVQDTSLTLKDVAWLKVGQVLRLDPAANARVILEVNGKPLFRCQLGRSDGSYTLRIEDTYETPDSGASPASG